MTSQTVSMTAEALARRADGSYEHDNGDTFAGTVFFRHESDWELTDSGETLRWVNASIIGAIRTVDHIDEMDVPEVMTEDQLYNLLGWTECREIIGLHEETLEE